MRLRLALAEVGEAAARGWLTSNHKARTTIQM